MARGREHAAWVGPLLAVLALGIAGCGDDDAGGSAGGKEARVDAQPGEVACGHPFRLPAPGGLRVAGRFAEVVPAGRQTVSGTVEVTSREAFAGVTAPAPDVFLVRHGLVVTTPPAQDAVGVRWEPAAGETRSTAASASLTSCEPGGGRLAPGRYELYARVVLAPDAGAPLRAFGGPWPLRVR